VTRSRARVAITGLGAVTPLGNDAASTWESLVAGRSGVGPLTVFDSSGYPVRIAGQVKNFEIDSYLPDRRLRRRLNRAAAFGVAAAVQAVREAGAASVYAPERRGVAMGGSWGRPPFEELCEMLRLMEESGGHSFYRQAPGEVVARAQNTWLAVIAAIFDCQGPMLATNTACSASAHSIGEAFRLIQEGDASMMLAGGADALTTYLDVLGFALLGALAADFNERPQAASRPFSADRSGFVLGEGAVVVLLEELESARRRGARIYAELAGYGSSMNAWRMTDSPPDGSGAIEAMAAALRESGVALEDVGYVAAHGTSTAGNDISETVAIKAVFGEHADRLAVSSPKSMSGHLTAAAGGLNLLAAAGAIRHGVVPPTINLEHPDPKLDLDYVPHRARRKVVQAALVNTFAFGGTNACLVLKRPEPA
jgi:3-oxoacyl-[acyl-carrier-protein] synthase II